MPKMTSKHVVAKRDCERNLQNYGKLIFDPLKTLRFNRSRNKSFCILDVHVATYIQCYFNRAVGYEHREWNPESSKESEHRTKETKLIMGIQQQ